MLLTRYSRNPSRSFDGCTVDSDATPRADNRLLHGFHCVHRAGVGARLFEGEKTTASGETGTTHTSGVHLLQTLLDPEWRGGCTRWTSALHHQHEHDEFKLNVEVSGVSDDLGSECGFN